MKNFFKAAKVGLMIMVCALFLGIGIKAEAAPGQVIGLKQIGADSGSVSIQWDAPSGSVVAYLVEWCQNENFNDAATYGALEVKGDTRGGKIPAELKAGTSYYVRVTAADNEAPGLASRVIEAVTAPSGKATGLKQTKAETKKITLSWKGVTGANAYDIAYRTSNTSYKYKTIANKTSYALSASVDTNYLVAVAPARKSREGFVAYGANYTDPKLMSTLPKKVAKVKFLGSGSGTDPKAGIADFSWNPCNAADGYEYVVYGNNGKKLFSKTTTSWKSVRINHKKLKKANQFMKIKVRGYLKVNGKKVYGPWSADCWFSKYPLNVKASMITNRAADGVRITWKKMTGAKNYTVYVTTTPGVSGSWKKVATTSGTSTVIKKCGGAPLTSYITYYYRVVPNKKVGKKMVKGDDSWDYKFTITTRYY